MTKTCPTCGQDIPVSQKERIAELQQDYDSMAKLFRFAVTRTDDEKKKVKWEGSAKLCEGMKDVCVLLFQVSEELLEKK